MHPKVEAYVQERTAKRKSNYDAEKLAFLRQECLTEFVPNPNSNVAYTEEYPCQKSDPETGKRVWGKMVPIEITDEEYELLRAASEKNGTANRNKVASILQSIAYTIYALGALAALIMLVSSEGYLFASALVSLVAGLISGTIFLGFAETIKLLQNISDKLK